MTNFFRETHKDPSGARTGILNINGWEIETPLFMPVGTQGTIKSLSSDDIDELDYELILCNTYHLYLRPGTSTLDKFGGVKNFMGYQKKILTDSGGYQIFSLNSLFKYSVDGVEFQSHIDGSKHKFSPESVIDIQRSINSDIMMVLDDCAPFGSDIERINLALKRTHLWAEKSYTHWQKNPNNQYLFGITQGGFFLEKRLESIEFLNQIPFSGIAVGGLSVGEPAEEFKRILSSLKERFDPERPRYIMGIGSIDYILDSVLYGMDMFDCVLPTRNARNGQVFTSIGKLNLKNEQWKYSDSPIDPSCNCKVCKRYSLGYLRHLHKVKELLAYNLSSYHNLYFMKNFIKKLQESIKKNDFMNFYSFWKKLY